MCIYDWYTCNTQAVELLRPGGTLVYSTCTITTQENEELVAWALNKHQHLQLQPQVGHIFTCSHTNAYFGGFIS